MHSSSGTNLPFCYIYNACTVSVCQQVHTILYKAWHKCTCMHDKLTSNILLFVNFLHMFLYSLERLLCSTSSGDHCKCGVLPSSEEGKLRPMDEKFEKYGCKKEYGTSHCLITPIITAQLPEKETINGTVYIYVCHMYINLTKTCLLTISRTLRLSLIWICRSFTSFTRPDSGYHTLTKGRFAKWFYFNDTCNATYWIIGKIVMLNIRVRQCEECIIQMIT